MNGVITRKYVPAGCKVKYGNIVLSVVATINNLPLCRKCYFSKYECRKARRKPISCVTHGFICTAHLRKDNQHVIFIKEEHYVKTEVHIG